MATPLAQRLLSSELDEHEIKTRDKIPMKRRSEEHERRLILAATIISPYLSEDAAAGAIAMEEAFIFIYDLKPVVVMGLVGIKEAPSTVFFTNLVKHL